MQQKGTGDLEIKKELKFEYMTNDFSFKSQILNHHTEFYYAFLQDEYDGNSGLFNDFFK